MVFPWPWEGTENEKGFEDVSRKKEREINWRWKVLYSLHNELILLHKYMSTEPWPEFTRVEPDPRDTITWDTICFVDNSRYLTGLSNNYSLTQFTCILFLLLEYIHFSINLFVFPMSFFCQHHNKKRHQKKK